LALNVTELMSVLLSFSDDRSDLVLWVPVYLV